MLRKTFTGSTVDWLKYLTPTDSWGNVTSVKAQSGSHAATEAEVVFNTPVTLASYTYGANNGPMTSMKYGNGDKEEYEYDLYGRLTATKYTTDNALNRTEASAYDSNGKIAHTVVTDSGNQVVGEYQYEYDSLGRLIRSSQNGSGLTRMRTNHKYDAQNRLSKQSWELPSRTLWETYTYNNANGTLASIESPVYSTLTYGYDDLQRLKSETVDGVYQRRRNYTNGTISYYHQTMQPNYFMYYKPDGTTMKLGYRYLYEADGNIREIQSQVAGTALATEYTFEYDKLGQLIKSVGPSGTETYTYDTAGNLLSRKLGSATATYTYGNGNWEIFCWDTRGRKSLTRARPITAAPTV